MVSEFDVIPSIIGILFLVIPAMFFGKVCKRFKIPEIIGFVLAGVFLGPFALGGIIPLFEGSIVNLDDVTIALWQISGIIILFAAGLHFTFHDLIRAGFRSAVIGIVGVITPLTLGFIITQLFGFSWEVAVLIGATLSATSIAISVTILAEIRKEKSKEGNILVNAAVLDDVLSLAVLSTAVSIITYHTVPTIESIVIVTLKEIGVWLAILLGAVFILPKIVHGIATARPSSLEVRGTKQAAALGSAFGFAAISSIAGLNPIVGAFAAGMGLAGSKLATQIREFIGRLKVIVEPLFFAVIGAHVNIGLLGEVNWIFFIAILSIAVLSKVLGCGIPASLMLRSSKKGFRIGYGMVARGEVAFITLGIGLAANILNAEIYSTLVVVILVTIIIAPMLLRVSYRDENLHERQK